jgi:hypothetical protein
VALIPLVLGSLSTLTAMVLHPVSALVKDDAGMLTGSVPERVDGAGIAPPHLRRALNATRARSARRIAASASVGDDAASSEVARDNASISTARSSPGNKNILRPRPHILHSSMRRGIRDQAHRLDTAMSVSLSNQRQIAIWRE